MRLLVIGGSDAGIAAALRARELAPSVEATVVVADAFPNFSICGLPYYLSGDVPDWRDLAHRATSDLEQAGLQLLLDHTAQAIDPAANQVTVTDPAGTDHQLSYDRLVIGTGAVPVRPPIDGLDLPGVHVLHTMGDTFRLHHALTGDASSVIIVSGGCIGLEMAAGAGRPGNGDSHRLCRRGPCQGVRRRRPVGMRIGGMSSSTASNMVASLAALRISDSGSPPHRRPGAAWARPCPDRRGLRRSGPPFDRLVLPEGLRGGYYRPSGQGREPSWPRRGGGGAGSAPTPRPAVWPGRPPGNPVRCSFSLPSSLS